MLARPHRDLPQLWTLQNGSWTKVDTHGYDIHSIAIAGDGALWATSHGRVLRNFQRVRRPHRGGRPIEAVSLVAGDDAMWVIATEPGDDPRGDAPLYLLRNRPTDKRWWCDHQAGLLSRARPNG